MTETPAGYTYAYVTKHVKLLWFKEKLYSKVIILYPGEDTWTDIHTNKIDFNFEDIINGR